MPVNFANDGVMDLDVVRTMGVNVKETDNPIGHFGTGLKYALATLLRTGHSVILKTGDKTYPFSTRTKTIRGKDFEMIMMGDEQLGFTADLGKEWKVWQAYRELYSNCMDEGGHVSTNAIDADTVITVIGDEIMEAHAMRDKIFLLSEPWLVRDGIEVHRGSSKYLYYRGVRVSELGKKSRYTYNFTTSMALTEDRTLVSQYLALNRLGTVLPRIPDTDFAARILGAGDQFIENKLEFEDCSDPSEEFLDALQRKYERDRAKMSKELQDMLKQHRNSDDFDVFILSEAEKKQLAIALNRLRRLNAVLSLADITFVEHAGPGIYACVVDNHIYVTRQCLMNGTDFLTITLYEEYIHLKMGYRDESRGMQQFLLDKILELIKE